MTYPFRITDAPAHDLHATQASTHNGGPLLDAQTVCQTRLAVDPVAHGNNREIRPIPGAGIRIDGCRACAACAAAEIVQADHKKVARINRFARSNTDVPPARLFVSHTVIPGRMVV